MVMDPLSITVQVLVQVQVVSRQVLVQVPVVNHQVLVQVPVVNHQVLVQVLTQVQVPTLVQVPTQVLVQVLTLVLVQVPTLVLVQVPTPTTDAPSTTTDSKVQKAFEDIKQFAKDKPAQFYGILAFILLLSYFLFVYDDEEEYDAYYDTQQTYYQENTYQSPYQTNL